MYRSIYVMYTHSYLIALTHSWAPRLRGIVLTTSHAPLYIEISTTDVGLSKSPRFHSDTECLLFSRYRRNIIFQILPDRDNHRYPACRILILNHVCTHDFRSGCTKLYQPGSSSWDMPVSCGVTTTWVPWYYIFHTHFFHVYTVWYWIILFACLSLKRSGAFIANQRSSVLRSTFFKVATG